MKNVIALAVLMITTASFAVAQDYSKLVKKAKRALNTYYLDQNNNEKDLMDARDLVQQAFEQSDEAKNDFDAQYNRGRILKEIFNLEITKSIADPNYDTTDSIAFLSAESLLKALELADKNWDKNDVLEQLPLAAGNLSNLGIQLFRTQQFDTAYLAFNKTLEIKDVLEKNGKGDTYLVKNEIEDFEISITYSINGNTSQQDTKTPWSKEFKCGNSENLYVSAQVRSDGEHPMIVKIYSDGKVISEARSSGEYVIASATARCSGNQISYAVAKDEQLKDPYLQQKYYTALAAQLGGKIDKANELYKELLDSGFKTAEVYEGLYRINSESNPEEAIKYLQEGRQLYPDSTNLLYAEINYYLKEGNIESLEDKLKLGIEKDPQNASLHITLGNVYDRLYQKAIEQGNKEKAETYFNNAIQKYEDAIEIDPELNDAYYSVGALYYNRAAEISKQMQELENDYSKEGLKKYEVLNKKVLGNFDKALPWFIKSEQKEPNDVNTLIALKEIYAKKGELELSQTFTDRLNQVRSGESLDSYFSE